MGLFRLRLRRPVRTLHLRRTARPYGPPSLPAHRLFFFAVGLVAIAAGHNSLLDVPASLLIGLGYAFPWPALALTVVNRVRVSERASALGALTAFYDAFVASDSAVAGAVAGHFGLTAVFWFAFLCMCGGVVLTLTTSIARVGPPAHANSVDLADVGRRRAGAS